MSATNAAYKNARRLRRTMSLPEILLWQILRARPSGLKFRRQHPRDHFPLDFYCASAKLVIEIDGISHDMGDRPARDAARDAWMCRQGMKTFRIAARDVLADPEAVASSIVAMCLERSKPLHRPSDGPPPHRSAIGRISE